MTPMFGSWEQERSNELHLMLLVQQCVGLEQPASYRRLCLLACESRSFAFWAEVADAGLDTAALRRKQHVQE